MASLAGMVTVPAYLGGLCICAYSLFVLCRLFSVVSDTVRFDPGVKFRTEFFQTVGVVILIKIVYFYVHHHFRNDMFSPQSEPAKIMETLFVR